MSGDLCRPVELCTVLLNDERAAALELGHASLKDLMSVSFRMCEDHKAKEREVKTHQEVPEVFLSPVSARKLAVSIGSTTSFPKVAAAQVLAVPPSSRMAVLPDH